ncbi:MAG: 4Fe-4S binding protein [Pseudoalteromonas distincta]
MSARSFLLGGLRAFCLFWLLVSQATSAAIDDSQIQALFPKATRIEPKQEDPPVYSVYQLDELLGYAFESNDYSSLQGFSGKPIRLLIGMDPQGVLSGVTVVEHHEPVFLHGLGEQALFDFVAQYRQQHIGTPIVVGGRQAETVDGTSITQFDGVSKATVSVVILNETVLAAAMSVARQLLEGFASSPLATPKMDLFEPLDWQQLLDRQHLQRWEISQAEAEAALGQRLAYFPSLQIDSAEQPFSTVYFAYLNTPNSGRNLLGQAEFDKLKHELKTDEQALLVISDGLYRHTPDDFTPASAPSRLVLMQNDKAIELHDMNYNNGAILELLNTPLRDGIAHIFRIKPHAGFNPAEPAELQLNVSLKRNPLVEDNAALSKTLTLDPALFDIQPPAAMAQATPIWLRMWQERAWQVGITLLALVLLTGVFLFQHRISRHSRAFHVFRSGFLVFTLVFLGLYAQGQLSVVNIFTLLLSLGRDFDLTVFLMDPVIFVLWSFTFISLFIWGRGLFCGWLCPFGALQEILAWLAKKLHIKQWKVADPLHRRLQWIKYAVLIGLVITSFISLTLAERLAEIEPFKTSITLFFLRTWPFVLYALALLGLGLFVHKFYCRYVCPLGAGLAMLGKYHLFAWLKRIDACGKPCQHCKNHCEIGAINRDGSIDYNECIQCLECIVILNNQDQCVASISAEKQAAKARKRATNNQIISTDSLWQNAAAATKT